MMFRSNVKFSTKRPPSWCPKPKRRTDSWPDSTRTSATPGLLFWPTSGWAVPTRRLREDGCGLTGLPSPEGTSLDHYYYSFVRRKGRDFDKVVTKVTLISAQVSPTLSKDKKNNLFNYVISWTYSSDKVEHSSWTRQTNKTWWVVLLYIIYRS